MAITQHSTGRLAPIFPSTTSMTRIWFPRTSGLHFLVRMVVHTQSAEPHSTESFSDWSLIGLTWIGWSGAVLTATTRILPVTDSPTAPRWPGGHHWLCVLESLAFCLYRVSDLATMTCEFDRGMRQTPVTASTVPTSSVASRPPSNHTQQWSRLHHLTSGMKGHRLRRRFQSELQTTAMPITLLMVQTFTSTCCANGLQSLHNRKLSSNSNFLCCPRYTPWAKKRSQLIFFSVFVKKLMDFTVVFLLDFKINGTCDGVNLNYLT